MKKGLFFSVPSISVSKTITGAVDEIAASACEIIYYNAKDFQPGGHHNFSFRPYPDHFKGYWTGKIDEYTSYFDFAEILVDSAASLIDFLKEEIEKEKPDFILHSHLALWGKLLARYYKLPSITLYSTFILDRRIMHPIFRKMNDEKTQGFGHLNSALEFYRKYNALFARLGLEGKPDPWNVHTNKGDLNLSFILQNFQPQRELFGKEFHFLGYPTSLGKEKAEKTIIYISMGTLLSQDLPFYEVCMNVLNDLQIQCVMSVGSKVTAARFRGVSRFVRVEEFVDQKQVLETAKLFIMHAGMASINEAIYTRTPMIVVPITPEQQLNAVTITDLKIGVVMQRDQVSYLTLKRAILDVLNNYEAYSDAVQNVCNAIPVAPPEKRAAELVDHFLNKSVSKSLVSFSER